MCLDKVGNTTPNSGNTILQLRGGCIALTIHMIISAETKLPAFTIHLLNQKAYMIISTNLVSSVQRNSKVISFEPLAATVAERVAGITGDGLKLYTPRELGGTGMVDKLLQTMHSVLLGADAEEMFSVTLKVLKKSLDNLQPSEPIELFSWCRHAVTAATTDAIYGPRNPYKERDFEDAMW